jgi:hypothetical protein
MLAAGGHLVRAALHAIGYLCIVSTMAMRRGCDARARYRAGHGIQLPEEDLAMSDPMPEPGNAGDQRGSEPDMSDTAEFAKMRAVMRASEKHREGGVDPELEDADADPALTPEPRSSGARRKCSSVKAQH